MIALRNFVWKALSLCAVFLFLTAERVFAVTSGGTAPELTFPSPLKDIGGIQELVERLLNDIVLPLGATVAAVFIVYAGFLYVKARGNKSELEQAHETIKWTLVGAAVILGASVIAALIGGTIEQLKN